MQSHPGVLLPIRHHWRRRTIKFIQHYWRIGNQFADHNIAKSHIYKSVTMVTIEKSRHAGIGDHVYYTRIMCTTTRLLGYIGFDIFLADYPCAELLLQPSRTPVTFHYIFMCDIVLHSKNLKANSK